MSSRQISSLRLKVFCLFQVLLGACLLWRPAFAELPEMHWEHVHPNPSGQWLNSAVWGDPGFVVVGSNRELLFSPDALHWQRITNDASKDVWYSDVCYYNGKYVAVGSGVLLWSTNGIKWHKVDTGTNSWLRSCAGGNGQYVISAGNSTLLVSTNAEDWQPRTAPSSFADIICVSNQWVAVTGGNKIYQSTDLVSWTYASAGFEFGSQVLNTICFGNGRFVACGAGGPDLPGSAFGSLVYWSSDGVAWSIAPLTGSEVYGEIQASLFAAGQFLAVKPRAILRSTNGETWEEIIGVNSSEAWRGIAGSPSGNFVSIGAQGALLVSSNGQSWQSLSVNPRVEIHSVAYANNRFVSVGGSPWYIGGPVGNAGVLMSTNGHTWRASLTNLENQLSAVAYGNGMWIVTGDDGGIYTSGDAINWTNRSLPATVQDLDRLVFGKGRFVAFAYSRDVIYHSTNGINWVSNNVPSASVMAKVRFLNGRFMAVGGSGLVAFSDNGVTWKSTIVSPTNHFEALAYGKGRYVIGGNDVVAYSLNGTNWTVQPSPFPVRDLLYADGWFMAVGTSMRMAFSRDGVHWTLFEEPIINDDLYALAYGDGVIVAGGNLSLYRSTLADSETFRKRLHLLWPPQLEFYGAKGFEYRVERTTNFVNWTAATGWTRGTNQYIYWQAAAFLDARRFWRVNGRPTP